MAHRELGFVPGPDPSALWLSTGDRPQLRSCPVSPVWMTLSTVRPRHTLVQYVSHTLHVGREAAALACVLLDSQQGVQELLLRAER